MKAATYSLLIVIAIVLTSCNPFYVIQAGITQSEILLNRRPIQEVLIDSDTPEAYKAKLKLVSEAREFSKTLSLDPKGSFQAYSALDRDILAWIVMGAQPDSFKLHTWWFPIVGSVPYKGYFSADSAECEAKHLRAKGYETLVRGTEAFSTLGWFNDPVMTPLLKDADHEVVNTVIHEILHTTLWIPNYVAFNESLANFIGHRGAISFFNAKLPLGLEKEHKLAEDSFNHALDISKTLSLLVPDLEKLYSSNLSKEEKLKEREQIFSRHIDPLRERISGLKILQKAHNAELLQLQLYYTKLDLFLKLWDKHQGVWSAFIEDLKELAKKASSEEADPFVILEKHIA
jgi:predicted aminopeptidase